MIKHFIVTAQTNTDTVGHNPLCGLFGLGYIAYSIGHPNPVMETYMVESEAVDAEDTLRANPAVVVVLEIMVDNG